MALTSQRWLCRCLAPGDAGTDAARNRLEAGRVSWPQVLRQANRGLVVTNLAAALDRRGLMPLAPAEVRDYLTTLHALNAERNQLLRRELARAAQACNAIGVEPLLLKGALALLPDSCPGAEARLMADLDLLIQAAAVDACQQALQDRLGYQPAPDWGYGEMGGSYRETITGLHRNPIRVSGYFTLKRVSDIAELNPAEVTP